MDLWLEHLNTPAVKAYLGGVQTREQVAERFARMAPAWDEDGFSFLAVERRSDGVFLGTCGLAPIAGDAAPEPLASGHQVGWQIRADAWGQGYASEAARALLAFGFEVMGLHRIYARCDARNAASARVMQRLGMRQEAHFREHAQFKGRWDEELVWAILEHEWFGPR